MGAPPASFVNPTDIVVAAEAGMTRARLRQLAALFVGVPSPTGQECTLAERIVAELAAVGLAAEIRKLDERAAVAQARLVGHVPRRPKLLMYAPIDTPIPGTTPATEARATLGDTWVMGLGAFDPKGHAACVLAAVEALAVIGAPLAADLQVSFGGAAAGPALAREGRRLAAAVVVGPGGGVACAAGPRRWCEFDIGGTSSYTGAGVAAAVRNAVSDAGHIVDGLARRAEVGGRPRLVMATPEQSRVEIELGASDPDTSVDAEYESIWSHVRWLADEIGADVQAAGVKSLPASATADDEPVARAAARAWTSLSGQACVPTVDPVGGTETHALRAAGVPTVRVGMVAPRAGLAGATTPDAAGNVVDVAEMERCARLLVRIAVDVCGVA